MTQKFRLEKGGYINRNKKISFKFNGNNTMATREILYHQLLLLTEFI